MVESHKRVVEYIDVVDAFGLMKELSSADFIVVELFSNNGFILSVLD